MLTTPLQLASVTASLSQFGRRMQPRMLYAVQDADENNHQMTQPKPLEPVTVIQKTHWDTVIEAMRKVVHSPHGTARRLSYNLPYTIAGKTGTAQVFGIKEDEEYKEEEVAKKLRGKALKIIPSHWFQLLS